MVSSHEVSQNLGEQPKRPINKKVEQRMSELCMSDTHAHLCDPSFDGDLELVLLRAREAGVQRVLAVSENPAEAEKTLSLAKRFGEMVRPSVGLFPTNLDFEMLEQVRALVERGAWSAIGEVGLDFWKVQDEEGRAVQQAIFSSLVELAISHELVVNVHSRSCGRQTLELLLEKGAQRVQMHAFDAKASTAMLGVEAGYFFSIPPSVLRSPQKQKLVARLPVEALLLESDSPVLGAQPGERNEPSQIVLALRAIAELKQLRPEALAEQLEANAERLYRWA
ncbi:MAG: TatD family hydrolase [Myxococcota bacterium]|jgi:TatD DNase family protein|nr:TatD family hydrolase [Myxococcota bacterium]